MAGDITRRIRMLDQDYTPSRIEILTGTEKKFYKGFDRKLVLIIPGEPVSDGRPRKNNELNIFYNEKKEYLKKIFRVMYRKDPLLQKTCIVTPHMINIQTYTYPNKTERQYLSHTDIVEEKIFSVALKDNDNVEKVNWDVLQDSEFMILLNDRYTVINMTAKYYSYNPRTKITIYYNKEYTSKLYEMTIVNSMDYRFFLCSKKYLVDIKDCTEDQQIRYLIKELPNIKSTAHKKYKYILSPFSISVINKLFHIFIFKQSRSKQVEVYIKRTKKDIKLDCIIKLMCTTSRSRNKYLELQKEIIADLEEKHK